MYLHSPVLLVTFTDNSSTSHERTHTQFKPKEAQLIVLSNFEEDHFGTLCVYPDRPRLFSQMMFLEKIYGQC